MTDIHILIDKFFDGNTSLEEEQQLYQYFSGSGVSHDLLPLQPMFLDLPFLREPHTTAPARPTISRRLFRGSVAAAATITALLMLATFAKYESRSQFEMEIYGKRYTDRQMVMQEVDRTMSAVPGGTPNMEDELHAAFGN